MDRQPPKCLAWLGCLTGLAVPLREGWHGSLSCVGMAWLVRAVLAATTSAGSRLPTPGCPLGLGGSRRGCGLVVVVGQQRGGGRGQGAGGQLGWVSATYRQVQEKRGQAGEGEEE
ncbi:hypothetical protein V8C86DRAFT_1403113 [Haematococcus lacustris]